MPRGKMRDDLFVPSEWLVQSTTGGNAARPLPTGSHFAVDLLQDIAWSDHGVALSDAELDHLVACPLCQEELEAAVLGARPEEGEFEPSEALVARVLHAPHVVRRVRSFQMPARPRRGVARRAFAALGLTPWSLAAAMVVHVAAFATTGTWIAAGTRGLDAQLHTRLAAAAEVPVYYYTLPTRPASAAPQSRARAQVPAATVPGPTTTPMPDSATRSQARRREAAAAVDRTFLFQGSEERMRQTDSTSLEEIVRVLDVVPDVNIRVEPAVDADAGERGSMVRFANRGAEMIVRFLRERGIDSGRIRVSPTQQISFGCASEALDCLRLSQRVHITIDTTTDRRRP
jgi:hypothetical protein